MEILSIDPTKVKVKAGLERFRQEHGNLDELMNSILRTRQILPIAITQDYELIDGGRRVAACILGGIEVQAVMYKTADDYEMRELEIEANLHRKDFTPAEEALAIRELHRLKELKQGKGADGWNIQKTAEVLGKSRGSVYNALEMASAIDAFPELKKAKKKSEISRAIKGLKRVDAAMDNLDKHKEAMANDKDTYIIHCKDALAHMASVDTGTINIILTDPIYGIGADLLAQTLGGHTGGSLTTAGYKITDEKEAAYLYYKALAVEGYRFTTEDAHGFIFVGPEHFWILREMFINEGWLVHVKPLIWIKREVGQCNIPASWPSSCYEMLMYIRKQTSVLVKQGRPDWIQVPPVNPSDKIHPYEKPRALIDELISRVSMPGQTLYDPFMGSGVVIESGIDNDLFCIGVDNSKEAYANAAARLAKKEKKK